MAAEVALAGRTGAGEAGLGEAGADLPPRSPCPVPGPYRCRLGCLEDRPTPCASLGARGATGTATRAAGDMTDTVPRALRVPIHTLLRLRYLKIQPRLWNKALLHQTDDASRHPVFTLVVNCLNSLC